MTMMRATLILGLGGFALAACDTAPADDGVSVVTRGTEPIYQFRGDGRIAATACLNRRASAAGVVPSACAVDSVFGQQVRYQHDLVRPHTPGPGSTYPPASAAYEYIYGEMPGDGRDTQPAPGVLIPVQPEAATSEEGEEGQ